MECHPLSLPSFFETGSFTEIRAYQLSLDSLASELQGPAISSLSDPLGTETADVHTTFPCSVSAGDPSPAGPDCSASPSRSAGVRAHITVLGRWGQGHPGL